MIALAARSVRDRARPPTCVTGPVSNSARSAESIRDAPRGLLYPRERSDQPLRQKQRSRVPSLLIGWGLGYWLISLLYLLSCSWRDGGWEIPPLLVTVVAYAVVPLVFVLGLFLVAEGDMLGKRAERVLQPVTVALKHDTRALHWAVVTVLRDVVILWLRVTYEAVPYLNIM